MNGNKKENNRNTKLKYTLAVIFVIIIISIITYYLYNTYIESKIRNGNTYIEANRTNLENIKEENNVINNTENALLSNSIYEDESIENIQLENTIGIEKESTNTTDKLKGYKSIATLEIPKIKLKTDVLSEYSEAALKISVTKFYGPDPNEIGNFCVSGHNYQRSNMFYKLRKVSENDLIYLTDNKGKQVTYKVYNIYKVDPKDTSCLSQNTEGKREITLITCTTDSKLRIIVKAREID